MTTPSGEWTVLLHERERILEVRYPERPTLDSFERYERVVRRAIEQLARGGPWDCLVDQSSVRALAPELTPLVASLNAWALDKGMRRTARVIADSAIGELQGARILRESGVKQVGALYKSRDQAWAALSRSAGSD